MPAIISYHLWWQNKKSNHIGGYVFKENAEMPRSVQFQTRSGGASLLLQKLALKLQKCRFN
jgi:hypothetical protein